MPYTKNPYMPKVRRDAAAMVRRGHTPTEVGRRFGVGSSTVCKWVKKAEQYGYHPIPTRSSRPRRHPHQISRETADLIVAKRLQLNRSAEVIHRALAEDGVHVSLSSVKRTLDRRGLLKKRSPWKRYHAPTTRPLPETPGALIQADTIHVAQYGKTRLYVFTLIDVCTRWAYARAYWKANTRVSLAFAKQAQRAAPFLFDCVQTDNGSEWSTHFTERVQVRHRHTRVRKSNDNAHIERFNRTLREELLDGVGVDVQKINQALVPYLIYYNETRHHFGINLLAPVQKLQEYVQAIE